jgi:hypothetical protein
MRDHYADVAAEPALDAETLSGHHGSTSSQQSGDHLDQLSFIDRAAAQLEIDLDVTGDRR